MHDRHRGPVGRPQQHLQSRQGSLFPCNAFLSARCASVNVNFHFLILPTPPRAPRCARIGSANGFFHYQSSRQHNVRADSRDEMFRACNRPNRPLPAVWQEEREKVLNFLIIPTRGGFPSFRETRILWITQFFWGGGWFNMRFAEFLGEEVWVWKINDIYILSYMFSTYVRWKGLKARIKNYLLLSSLYLNKVEIKSL